MNRNNRTPADSAPSGALPDAGRPGGTDKPRFHKLDWMRFLGITLIMGHHLYVLGYEGDYLCMSCWVWVDFFFILSGALTHRHFRLHPADPTRCGSESIRYTFHKFRRFLLPALLSVLALYGLENYPLLGGPNWTSFFWKLPNALYEILFLSSSGLTTALNAPIWYLSALFIVLPLTIYLMTAHREFWRVAALLIPIVYFGKNGVNTLRAWPNDLLRALACLSVGTLADLLAEQLWERLEQKPRLRLPATVLEALCVLLAVYLSVGNKPCINLMEFLFLGITALMLTGRTHGIRVHTGFCKLLGALSLPMFLFHWLVGNLVRRLNAAPATRVLLYYGGTLLLSALYVWLAERRARNAN